MIWNVCHLLAAETSASNSQQPAGNAWGTWIIMGVALLAIVLLMVFNSRSQKKRRDEMSAQLDAIRPGSKVKTIGGICGVVVEVNPEDNTFVLETGSEGNKSYLRFDKQAVYQTDAVAKKADPQDQPEATEPAEEVFEESQPQETAETAETAEEATETVETEATETTEEKTESTEEQAE